MSLLSILKTTKRRKEEDLVLRTKITAMGNAYEMVNKADAACILEMKTELITKRDYLNSRKRWLFNWTSGGWNSSFGRDAQEALADAIGDKRTGTTLVPDPNTFRLQTDEDEKSLMRSFY